jgi:N-acetylglucosamine-1-phosphodiester alpha-N-acetylglucosaminidase
MTRHAQVILIIFTALVVRVFTQIIPPRDDMQYHNDMNSDFVTKLISQAYLNSSTPVYVHKTYNATIFGRRQTGNYAILSNPSADHFHLYPSPSGCPGKAMTTVNAKAHHCVIATNAGFFNVKTGDCIGYVVSDRKIILNPGTKLSSFGLIGTGKAQRFVAGYLTQENVEKLGFSQLVTGALWLVRDGKSFVNESIKIEGISKYFCELKAPRLVIGHNKDGELMVIAVNGNEPTKEGVDVWELTEIVLSLGFENAVNLDGGGSTTFVVNQNDVVSRCTDNCASEDLPLHCPNSATKCQRRVTTTTCFN